MTAEQQLIRLYQQAARRLRAQIKRALASGQIGTAAYQTQQLRAVETELRLLGKKTRPLISASVFENYARGAAIVDVGLQVEARFEFAGAHRQAAEIFARNIDIRLADARTLIGRRADDAFRRVAIEQSGLGVATGSTRREISAGVERQLIEQGVTDALTGFVDSRGARWQIDTYAEMIGRTTPREAMSLATASRMRELSQDLIEISAHPGACEICVPYEGQTWSLDGLTEGYDVIDQLPPFHPNCRHVATPAGANLAALERELGLVV